MICSAGTFFQLAFVLLQGRQTWPELARQSGSGIESLQFPAITKVILFHRETADFSG